MGFYTEGFEFSPGDHVRINTVKHNHITGVVLEMGTNPMGTERVKVLQNNGVIEWWYFYQLGRIG